MDKARFKCIIDMSFSNHNKRVGLEMCIRDDTCAFVQAKPE